MSAEAPKPGTDWRRIGLIAAVTLVPGGFLLGAALAVQRMRANAAEAAAAEATEIESDPNDREA